MERCISFCFIAAAATSASAIAEPLFAQPVSVSLESGVHVRAPFTSVDVFPGGGVRVRAPYTAIDIVGKSTFIGPSHAVRRPVARTELYTQDELRRMEDADLWRAVRETSDRFMHRVGRFDTGVTWQRYLRLPDELQADTYDANGAQRDSAAALLQRFDEIAADAHYRKISDLPAFVAMRMALAELTRRPEPSGSVNRTELLPAPRFESAPAERSLPPTAAQPLETP